jgi:hypothetical protein
MNTIKAYVNQPNGTNTDIKTVVSLATDWRLAQ